jgi:hypothetical protein
VERPSGRRGLLAAVRSFTFSRHMALSVISPSPEKPGRSWELAALSCFRKVQANYKILSLMQNFAIFFFKKIPS